MSAEQVCKACAEGNIDTLKDLLKAPSIGVNSQSPNAYLPIHCAAMARSNGAECLKILLEARADLAGTTNEGRQAIHLAAENPNGVDALILLIAARANLDAKSTAARTPLHFSAVEGILETTQALLDAKANVNAENSCGAIPLHWAGKTGKRQLCDLLVQAKSDLTVVDNLGRTPAEMAADNRHDHLVALLKG